MEHKSDCAIHNAPAEQAGVCDCGQAEDDRRVRVKVQMMKVAAALVASTVAAKNPDTHWSTDDGRAIITAVMMAVQQAEYVILRADQLVGIEGRMSHKEVRGVSEHEAKLVLARRLVDVLVDANMLRYMIDPRTQEMCVFGLMVHPKGDIHSPQVKAEG